MSKQFALICATYLLVLSADPLGSSPEAASSILVQSQQYIGCYDNHGNTPALAAVSRRANMTLEYCAATCRENSKTFMSAYGRVWCFCGETFVLNRLDGSNSECDQACGGNNEQICGGGSNRLSLYWVCPIGKYGVNCENDCHCKPSTTFNNHTGCLFDGTCPVGCDDRWKGQHCDIELPCPEDFVYLPVVHGCYHLLMTPLNWTSAGHGCKLINKKSHLVVVDNAAEQKAVRDLIWNDYGLKPKCVDHRMAIQLWTAGQRVVPDLNTSFVWKDVSFDGSFTETFFIGHTEWPEHVEPVFASDESCLALDNQHDYAWNDYSCHAHLCSVCQIDLF
jgi:hypothetical protein